MVQTMNNSWEEIIIVGLGNHSKTKIIPAIEKTCSSKISILSTQTLLDSKYKIYNSLEKALEKDNKKLFVLTNPPTLHYEYCKKILKNGFDLFIEKPIFLKNSELEETINIAKTKRLVLYEMLMYLENDTINETLDLIKNNLNNIQNIYTCFNLPSYPINTYRNEKHFSSSLVTDIGCYPFSFLSNFEYHTKFMEFKKNSNIKNNPLYEIILKGEKFDVNIQMGINKIYSNFLRILFNNQDFIDISPFYYGRNHENTKIKSSSGVIYIDKIIEKNAYEKMFLKRRIELMSTQENRFKKMKKTIKLFNMLRKFW